MASSMGNVLMPLLLLLLLPAILPSLSVCANG